MRDRLLSVFLALLGALASQAFAFTDRHVVVISIDGLRPVYYLPGKDSKACPTLVSLRKQGAHAERAISVYPSFTYPAHASIVTGVNPARHGVTGNSMFAPVTEREGRGFWYASDLQSPALWDLVHAASGTVGAVSWPSSAGTDTIDWNLPEFWTSSYGHEITLVRRYASSNVITMAEQTSPRMTISALMDGERRDVFLAAAAAQIIREKKPGLMFVHLTEYDHEEHRLGPSSPAMSAIMHKVDGLVSGIVDAVRDAGIYDRTTFIVLGDHGVVDIKSRIVPNVLLAQHGFIETEGRKATNWTAMILNSGGSAGVYVNPKAPKGTAKAVQALLTDHAQTADGRQLYTIIPKKQLIALGGPTQAVFYLEAEIGYMFSITWSGVELVRSPPVKGNHGYLPTKPEMATGFIICGRGVKPGVVLPEMHLIDVAPTVAELLGLDMPAAEGRVLREMLDTPPAPKIHPSSRSKKRIP